MWKVILFVPYFVSFLFSHDILTIDTISLELRVNMKVGNHIIVNDRTTFVQLIPPTLHIMAQRTRLWKMTDSFCLPISGPLQRKSLKRVVVFVMIYNEYVDVSAFVQSHYSSLYHGCEWNTEYSHCQHHLVFVVNPGKRECRTWNRRRCIQLKCFI